MNNDLYNTVDLFIKETNYAVNNLRRQIKTSFNKILSYTIKSGSKNIKIKAVNATQGYIEIIPLNNELITVSVSVNGVSVYNGNVNSTVNEYCGFYQGVNDVLVSSTSDILIKVYGNVDYYYQNTSIYHSNVNGVDIISCFNGENLTFYSVTSGVLTKLKEVESVLQGVVVNATNNSVVVAYINNLNGVYLGEFTPSNSTFSIIKDVGYKGNSVFGFYVDGKYQIYVTRLNSVFYANTTLEESTTFSKTTLLGKIGYSDYNYKNAFITVDNLKTSRLVVKNANEYITCNVPNGSNYHITESENGLEITYFDGVSYRAFNFVDGKISNNHVISYAFEEIKFNNQSVIHVNGELKIVKE